MKSPTEFQLIKKLESNNKDSHLCLSGGGQNRHPLSLKAQFKYQVSLGFPMLCGQFDELTACSRVYVVAALLLLSNTEKRQQGLAHHRPHN